MTQEREKESESNIIIEINYRTFTKGPNIAKHRTQEEKKAAKKEATRLFEERHPGLIASRQKEYKKKARDKKKLAEQEALEKEIVMKFLTKQLATTTL